MILRKLREKFCIEAEEIVFVVGYAAIAACVLVYTDSIFPPNVYNQGPIVTVVMIGLGLVVLPIANSALAAFWPRPRPRSTNAQERGHVKRGFQLTSRIHVSAPSRITISNMLRRGTAIIAVSAVAYFTSIATLASCRQDIMVTDFGRASDNQILFQNLDFLGKYPNAAFINGDEINKKILSTWSNSWRINTQLIGVTTHGSKAGSFNLQSTLMKYTTNLRAIELYRSGYDRYSLYTEAELRASLDSFQLAIHEDTNFVLAYAAAMDALSQLRIRSWDTTQSIVVRSHDLELAASRIKRGSRSLSLTRALALQMLSRASEVQVGRSRHLFGVTRQMMYATYDSALALFDSARSISDGCPITRNNAIVALIQYSDALLDDSLSGRAREFMQEADSLLSVSIEQNPYYPTFRVNRVYYYLTRYEQSKDSAHNEYLDSAIVAGEEALRLMDIESPHRPLALYNQACAFALLGTPESGDSAIHLLRESLEPRTFNFCAKVRNDEDLLYLDSLSEYSNLLEWVGCKAGPMRSVGPAKPVSSKRTSPNAQPAL